MDLRFLVNLAAAARTVVNSPTVRRICTLFVIRTRIIVEELTGIHAAQPDVYYPIAKPLCCGTLPPANPPSPVIPLFLRQY